MQNQAPAPKEGETPAPKPTLYALSALVDDFAKDHAHRRNCHQSGQPLGPLTPWEGLNYEYGGGMPEGLHILLGGSGAGKTAAALQFLSSCQCPALYVTCEMRPLELLRRMAARTTCTELRKFKTGEMDHNHAKGLIIKTAQAHPWVGIADATTAYADPAWIMDAAAQIRGLNPESPYLLIIKDSIHAWAESSPSDASEYEQISTACQSLRTMAARLECTILAIGEKNRAAFNKNAGKEQKGISSGAGSRKLEFGSESVLTLNKDGDSLGGSNGEYGMTLTVEKNRNGSANQSIQLLFDGPRQHFAECKEIGSR
jgi:replicative DNA helicase